MATKVFDVAEVVYKTIIQDRVPGEPAVILESQLFTMVAERLSVNAVNNTYLDTTTGSFQMPTMDSILSENTSFVDSKVGKTSQKQIYCSFVIPYINLLKCFRLLSRFLAQKQIRTYGTILQNISILQSLLSIFMTAMEKKSKLKT